MFEKYTLFQPCSCILVSILAFSSFNLILSTYGAKGSKVEFLQLLKVANTECLRPNVCNFRESLDSREFLNFFIFCPHNLYSTLISKITLKLVTAFYFFLNRAKFEKRQIGALSSMKLAKIKHFLRART